MFSSHFEMCAFILGSILDVGIKKMNEMYFEFRSDRDHFLSFSLQMSENPAKRRKTSESESTEPSSMIITLKGPDVSDYF